MEVKELAKTSQQGLPSSIDVKPLSISNVHSNGTDSASPTSHRALDIVSVKAEVKPEVSLTSLQTATFKKVMFH